MLKVCYVAFSVEVLLLDPIALLLMLYSRSACMVNVLLQLLVHLTQIGKICCLLIHALVCVSAIVNLMRKLLLRLTQLGHNCCIPINTDIKRHTGVRQCSETIWQIRLTQFDKTCCMQIHTDITRCSRALLALI